MMDSKATEVRTLHLPKDWNWYKWDQPIAKALRPHIPGTWPDPKDYLCVHEILRGDTVSFHECDEHSIMFLVEWNAIHDYEDPMRQI